MTDENTQEVAVVAEMALVAPVDAEQILEAFRKFEWLKSNVIGPNDRQKISNTSFIKKSGWLKVALSCNLSLEKREERVERDDGDIIYHYTFRAIASSGRFADADGSASSSERAFTHVPHDIRTLAQTRACNRSIANLVGGGEVSAEEMSRTPQEESPRSDPTNILDTVLLKKGWNWNRLFEKYSLQIEKRHKELGEKKFTFEFAAVVVAREKGLVDTQELPT